MTRAILPNTVSVKRALQRRPKRVRLHVVRDMLTEALHWAEEGIPVFPCNPRDKSPLTRNGFKDATTDEQQIRKWWAKHPNAMIGMPTGRVAVLDIDFKPGEGVDGYKSIPNWESLSPCYAHTPSGGAHLYFKSSGTVPCSTCVIAPGIDTRGEGGYVILPPSRNVAGKYSFIKGDLTDDLPAFPADLLAKLKQPHHHGEVGDDGTADPKLIAAALEVIPNPASLSYDEWKHMGMAIWRATQGSEEGFAIFDAWSRKHADYDEANTRKAWEQITRSPPERIGAGTIFYLANQADPNWCDDLLGALILSPESPLDSARKFVAQEFMHEGVVRLVYHRGVFYEWTSTHYVEVNDDALRSKLYHFLEKASTIRKQVPVPFNPTQNKVNQIIDALKAGVNEDSMQGTPMWKGSAESLPERPDVRNLIAFKNGVLDIETRTLHPHSPHLFNVNCLPFDYDPEAPEAQRWLQFLVEIWPKESDVQSEDTLQEIFGLLLTRDTRYQKIFMAIGPARSGRGTLTRVLRGLLGEDNVADPTYSSLGTDFGMEQLIDKQIAIISDARLGAKVSYAVVERLLSISGEDNIGINRKFKKYWTGRLGVRFFIVSNELPRFNDASGALATRFIILQFHESFLGREDLDLTNKLLAERSGIINWALEGLDRVRQRGCFEMPETSKAAMSILQDMTSPVKAFVRQWCVTGAKQRINTHYLYNAYCRWCEKEGHASIDNAVFGRDLKSALPQLGYSGHHPKRCYIGIDLSDEGDAIYTKALQRER